jgi:hypothetical protein
VRIDVAARTAAREGRLLTQIPALDAILDRHTVALGEDLAAYRNHAYRVANLCASQGIHSAEAVEKIAIAAAFHDLGIWTDRTFDYLEPSVRLARAHLVEGGHPEWIPEVAAAILVHHKVSRYRGPGEAFVEAFRRADWMDVTAGVVTFGLSRALLGSLVARWPRAGLHRLLVRLEIRRLRTHPWNPLPMVKF